MQYARQRSGQTAREFHFELQQAQREVAELGMSRDELEAWRYIHGLHDHIKAGILGETKESRSTLRNAVDAAQRNEELEKRKRKRLESGRKPNVP